METTYNKTLKEWTGPNRITIFNPLASVGSILLHCWKMNPDNIGFIFAETDTKVTNAEMRLRSIRIAQNVKDLGLGQEDVVAIISDPRQETISLWFGLILNGTPFENFNLSVDQEMLTNFFSAIKPSLVICPKDKLHLVQTVQSELGNKALTLLFDDPHGVDKLFISTRNEEKFKPNSNFDSTKHILFFTATSGTTGIQKVAKISHSHIISRSMNTLGAKDVYFMFAPVSWSITVELAVALALQGTAQVFSRQPFNPKLQVDLIEKYKITAMFLVQHHMTQLIEYLKNQHSVLNSIKYFWMGGTKIFEVVIGSMKFFIPNASLLNCYGMSETLGITDEMDFKRSGSVGKLSLPDKIKIIDYEGQRLGPNELGEVCIKVDFPFLGYVGKPSPSDGEGFFPTGDMGYMDEDCFLYLEGRKKDIIKYRDTQFNATSVEQFIISKTKIREVCVVGLNDPVLREVPAAAIVKSPNCQLNEEDIQAIVSKNLPDYKHLDAGVYFVEKLPYTLTGKIKRIEVVKMVEELAKKKRETDSTRL